MRTSVREGECDMAVAAEPTLLWGRSELRIVIPTT